MSNLSVLITEVIQEVANPIIRQNLQEAFDSSEIALTNIEKSIRKKIDVFTDHPFHSEAAMNARVTKIGKAKAKIESKNSRRRGSKKTSKKRRTKKKKVSRRPPR